MKRNAKGGGSVRQRKDGTWEARATINGVRRSFYGARQSDALRAMRAAQKNADEGAYFEPTRASVGKWLDTWIDEYVAVSCKRSTLSVYKERIDGRIKPALGNIKLKELNATQIQSFYNSLLNVERLAPSTIKHIHAILHRALDKALQLRHIAFNPADACTLPRVEKEEVKPLTEFEIGAFLEEIEEGEPLKDLFTVALFTGMREGEICGLSWNSVDLKAGTLTVQQQLIKDRGVGGAHYIASTKSDKPRTLTLAPFVVEVLKNVRRRQIADRRTLGLTYVNEFNLVFTNADGRYIAPHTARMHFKRIASRIGRPDARFHDLRHTYAVTALQEGDHVKTVQQNLGHATASFTLDVYGHVSEKMKAESAAKMQAFFEKIKA